KTTGYKRQMVVTESFENMVISRVQQSISGAQTHTPIGEKSMLRTVSQTATIHSQGSPLDTGRNLDAAIVGEGFFALQTGGGTVYTRKGDFNIDADGYLVQSGGRVMGQNGPIRVGTENVAFDTSGNVYADGAFVGKLAIYSFDDYNTLTPVVDGYYTAAGGAKLVGGQVKGKALEGSNVDMGEEMTNAIAAQRELQSQSNILKMYDAVLQKATNEIGRIN
ncbi:MAG: flagellar hook-basal body complex protein, partial [Oscillospiraceae bacterium]